MKTSPSASPAAACPAFIPHTIADDFETGEMRGWESYPYAQDIGYDPFTVTVEEPTHGGSRFALCHTHRAHDAVGFRQGFTKEIDLQSVADTQLRVALLLMADRRPAHLELSLGAFDGRRFRWRLDSPAVGAWLELGIPRQDFADKDGPLPPGVPLQAVTIQVAYRASSHLFGYSFCMDDFQLNGARQQRFVTLQPRSTTFPLCRYSVLHRHFRCGEPLAIHVVAETDSLHTDARSAIAQDGGCGHDQDAGGTVDPGLRPAVDSDTPVVGGSTANPAISPALDPDSPCLPGALHHVTADLLDPTGHLVACAWRLVRTDHGWRLPSTCVVPRGGPAGQWSLRLSGSLADGKHIRWTLRFLALDGRLSATDHPRLYFSREDLQRRLKSPSSTDTELVQAIAGQWGNHTEAEVDSIPEVRDVPAAALTGHQFARIHTTPRWHASLNRLAGLIRTGSLRHVFAGDEAAGRVARRALLKLCASVRWNHPWQLEHRNHTYYPMGYTVGAVALGYDLLYPLLDSHDRRLVRDALVQKGLRPFHRDMVEMNRMPGCVTNHLAVLAAHMAMAVTAIHGEDADDPWMEPYFSGILEQLRRFIERTYYPDGGYGEPIGYQQMATRDLVKALHVLQRNFGIDLSAGTALAELYRYPLHAADSDGTLPDFGDVHLGMKWAWDGDPLLWLAHHTRNPWAVGLCRRAPDPSSNPFARWLWETRDVEAKAREELLPSRCFPVEGKMVMRSDWSDQAVKLIFKCGPNSNHYHVDQGTFVLQAHGELLLSEAGLKHNPKGFHSYYSDLYYPVYTTQAVAHNVLLIDGDPESQIPADYRKGVAALENWPRLRSHLAARHWDWVQGDLTCVYKEELDLYTRSFLFLKPDLVVMWDHLRSPQPHTFSWLFHGEDLEGEPSFHLEETGLRLQRPNAFLEMEILAPQLAPPEVRRGQRDESFAQWSTKMPTQSADLVAVLIPGAGAMPEGVQSQAERLETRPGWTGIRIRRRDAITEVFICHAAASGPLPPSASALEAPPYQCGARAAEEGPEAEAPAHEQTSAQEAMLDHMRGHEVPRAQPAFPAASPDQSSAAEASTDAQAPSHEALPDETLPGACFAVHRDEQGRLRSFFLHGRTLSLDEIVLRSDRPVSVSGFLAESGTESAAESVLELEIQNDQPIRLVLWRPADIRNGSADSRTRGEDGSAVGEDPTPPVSPHVLGLENTNWRAEAGRVRLDLAPGHARVAIHW